LDIWILFDRDPAELLHGSLLFNLVSLLQATLSFFLGGKNDRRLIMANGLRVATFYDLPDILIWTINRCGLNLAKTSKYRFTP